MAKLTAGIATDGIYRAYIEVTEDERDAMPSVAIKLIETGLKLIETAINLCGDAWGVSADAEEVEAGKLN